MNEKNRKITNMKEEQVKLGKTCGSYTECKKM